MVVENVRGAQKWVGRAKWHYGSYYLWGDVPALMPKASRLTVEGGKIPGQHCGRFRETGQVSPHWRLAALDGIKQNGSGPEGFDNGIAKLSSQSQARKQASALIAKIPFPLAQHIARVYKS